MGVLQSVVRTLFGSANDRFLKSLTPTIQRINGLAPQFDKLSDTELRQSTDKFRQRLADKSATLEDLLPEAFAAVREAGRRFLNMRHYDVQLIGGIVLHQGKIAEMVTGEGKTLVATLPAYLNALTGKGVHVITVNDYLAQRDSDWMAPIYRGLGMKVGAIQSNMNSWERHPHYAADITYGTNNEFGFDYLRDNMKPMLGDQVQGPLHYSIIDEVDSILIDEARTPLIISGSTADDSEKYREADKVVRALGTPDRKTLENKYFKVEEKDHRVDLTEDGMEKVSELLGIDNIWGGGHMEWPHLISNALKAHHLYKREQHYEIKDGEVKIVDEFTGRIMEGRRWSDGLHQAIEAKEEREGMGVRVREEQRTLASITLQNYFRLYDKISGMTGTAATEAAEFFKIYKLDVVEIPTNRPLIRKPFNDLVFGTTPEKYEAMAEEIANVAKLGRPVLVGTTSVEKSMLISHHLQKIGFGLENQRIASGDKKRHYVLNARISYENQNWEADVVAQAGRRMVAESARADIETFGEKATRASVKSILDQVGTLAHKYSKSPGMVIIATNMAGRGTDILLGGHAGHFFYNYLLGEQAMEEAERKAEEKKKKKGGDGDGPAPADADETHDLFSQLHAILAKADALPYPMKDPATVTNPKERDGIQRAVAEAFQAMLNVTDAWFDGSRAADVKPLFEGLVSQQIFTEFFAHTGEWVPVLSQFFGRSMNPNDPVPARRFIADLIRLTLPMEQFIDRQLDLRVKMLKAEKRGESGWFEALKEPKWRKRLRKAEEWVRDCFFNKILVLCPQFFSREALGINEAGQIKNDSPLPYWFEAQTVGGLHVLGTERHESRRVDNQLRGRCGRQGDPGSSQFFLSLEDDLMRIFAGPSVKRILQMAGLKNGQPIQAKMVSNSVQKAQKKVEQRNFDTRKNLLEYADVMNRQRGTVYNLRQSVLEGLTSEPNPLRYRALRIPGSVKATMERHGDKLDYESWFEWWQRDQLDKRVLAEGDEYLPLDPALRKEHLRRTAMRMVENSLSRVIDEYAHPTRAAGNWDLEPFEDWFNTEFASEAEPVNHQDLKTLSLHDMRARLREKVLWEKDPAIAKIHADTKDLKKAEVVPYAETFEQEFNVTLDEDDMTRIEQTPPKNAGDLFVQLYREQCRDRRERQVGRGRLEELDNHLDGATSGWDVPGLCRWLSRSLLLEVTPQELAGKDREEVEEYLNNRMENHYAEREKELGEDHMRFIEQYTLLQTIDARWKDHLREMDFLRSAVAFAGMTQRDPKIEYKIRGLEMFQQMLGFIETNFTEKVLRMRLVDESEIEALSRQWAGAQAQKQEAQSAMGNGQSAPAQPAASGAASGGGAARDGANGAANQPQNAEPQQIKRDVRKIKPNEPCPCNSGKKYKKCHGLPGAGPLPAEALRKLK